VIYLCETLQAIIQVTKKHIWGAAVYIRRQKKIGGDPHRHDSNLCDHKPVACHQESV